MYVLARPIYYLMYGGANLDYGEGMSALVERLLALVTTITPICSSMMMTLHFRKASIFYLFVGFVVQCVTFYPLIRFTGYSGAITSSVLCSVTIIYLCLAKISNKFGVNYSRHCARWQDVPVLSVHERRLCTASSLPALHSVNSRGLHCFRWRFTAWSGAGDLFLYQLPDEACRRHLPYQSMRESSAGLSKAASGKEHPDEAG